MKSSVERLLDQAVQDLACIDSAREAVELARGRIRAIRALSDCRESWDALSDAENSIMDAFDDAVGKTELALKDRVI